MHLLLVIKVFVLVGHLLVGVEGQAVQKTKKVCFEVPGNGQSNETSPEPGSSKTPLPTAIPSPGGTPSPTKTPSPPETLTPPRTPSPFGTPFPPKTPSPSGAPFPPKTLSSKGQPVESKAGDKEVREALRKLTRQRWPRGEVPFVFHPGFRKRQIPQVTKGIERISNLTCIRFKDLTGRVDINDRKEHKVIIQNLSAGCFATLGYNKYLRTTYINLEMGCFPPSGTTILHELSHTLGIIHSQSRYDRDEYLVVHYDKIQQGKGSQFDKREGMYGKLSLMGLPYDFNSVMHYSTNAFAKDPKDNTMSLKKDFPGEAGFPKRLTRADVATINRLYECTNHYLGDDIPGAMPYKQWRETYVQ